MHSAGATEAQGAESTTSPQEKGLLELPLLAPRIHTRPWWFPVFQPFLLPFPYTSLSSLGPNQVLVPKIEWMSQALLMVDTVNAENLVEITVFGRPTVQHRVKNVLLSLASRHREHRARAEKMEQLEEFLKHPVA
uniref:KH-like RNA-binding domain-containing protein n=1 Tax=Sus scrofa TaxID=9823 RepID=A0A8D1CAB3_PIG